MGVADKDLVSVAANNRFAVLPGFDRASGNLTVNSVKLRALRGSVSAMGLLPLNQLMLVGTDTGVVTLYS
jgi:hypothetical protein